MTLKEVLYKRDDALMEILNRMKGKKLYNNLWVQLRFFWQETKRAVYCATPWKDAQGDDLPEYDREVIAILDYDFGHYKVVYAHRPNPNGWDGTNIVTGKVEHYTPKTYGKGGWNIPDVVLWLDLDIPQL